LTLTLFEHILYVVKDRTSNFLVSFLRPLILYFFIALLTTSFTCLNITLVLIINIHTWPIGFSKIKGFSKSNQFTKNSKDHCNATTKIQYEYNERKKYIKKQTFDKFMEINNLFCRRIEITILLGDL
jgi:hypothetical protein